MSAHAGCRSLPNAVALRCLLILAALVGAHRAASASVENVHEVDRGRLYRSARAERYEDFRSMIIEHHIGRIVNVEDDVASVNRERGWLDRLWREDHIRVDHDWKQIKHRDVQDARYIEDTLNSARDAKNGAVWLHCKRGRDRTGFIAALYRVRYQGWKRADARDEWHDARFNGGRLNSLRFAPLEGHFDYATRGHH